MESAQRAESLAPKLEHTAQSQRPARSQEGRGLLTVDPDGAAVALDLLSELSGGRRLPGAARTLSCIPFRELVKVRHRAVSRPGDLQS